MDSGIPPISTWAIRLQDTQLQPLLPDQSQSTFYRNLKEVLDVRRSSGIYYSIVKNAWQADNAVDFCSGDVLSLAKSDVRRAKFLAELAREPNFGTGSSGIRLMDGNYTFLERTEQEIAAFHGAEMGLIVGAAFEANVAVWSAVPRPGDVIVYDALVHASTHEGFKHTLAMEKFEFPHNDVEAFRQVLVEVFESQKLIRQGKRSVLVAVESIYSMDGDVCPLQEFVDVARKVSKGQGNIQFVVDEAHSVGVIGPKGAGLVCALGLQQDIAVVVHSYGKAMGAAGAVILGNKIFRGVLANFARSVIYTTSPSFPFVAAIKSGYTLLESGFTEEAQERIQDLAKVFFEVLTSHPTWPTAQGRGLLSVPLADGWEDRRFLSHIIPILTRPQYTCWLHFHLLAESFCVFPVEYPTVPLGKGRLRVTLHASNSVEQVEQFINAVFSWIEEMINIEDQTGSETVSHAAKGVYAWMRREKLSGLPQGAEDENSFWDMLVNGKNVMTEWPKSRANIDAFYYPQSKIKNTLSSKGAHFLQGDPGAFDAPFFSLTPTEAASLDPQQRWVLEATYRAMENAGIPVERAAGTDTAVFAGSMSNDYAKLIYKDPDESPSNTSVGTSPAILANRISCLIATDLACQCLRSGQSSMALVAGSNTIFTPEESLHLESMNFLSPHSRSYSFDDRADGYARGEGAVVLVLKKLKDALQNGDMIRAIIRASASNQDGHTPGITQPNFNSQETLIRRVYESCGLGFDLTRYVEAHGSGSVKSNIGHLEGASGLAGIVKTILILERGIIPPNALFQKWNSKINFKFNNLQVPTSCIPWPTQGLRRISVNSFGFGGSNCHVILDDSLHSLQSIDTNALFRTPLSLLNLTPSTGKTSIGRVGGELRRGKESANGYYTDSKTHAPKSESVSRFEALHQIYALKQKKQELKPSLAGNLEKFQLLVWSAKDEAGLERVAEGYKRYCEQHAEHLDVLMEPLTYTLCARRSLMPWRSFAVITNQRPLDSLRISPSKGVRSSKEPGLAFIFTGQGAQYARMGLDLLVYPVFDNMIARASNVLQELGAEWLLLEELRRPERINSPEKSQPLCTALQIALVELLREFGIVPDAVLGHSSGEIAVAYTTGALSVESALKVAYYRGKLAQKLVATTPEAGGMMSVNITETDIGVYLKKLSLDTDIFVACVNSPYNITVSGKTTAIDDLERVLEKDGIFTRKLLVDVAYHSPAMQQIAEDYLSCIGLLQPQQRPSNEIRRILMASSVTGLGTSTSAFSRGQYWVENLVSPVQFVDALQYLVVAAPKIDGLKPISTYLEIGPHGALKRPIADTLDSVSRGKSTNYFSVLSKFESPVKSTLEVVGNLFTMGHPVSVSSTNQLDDDSHKFPFLVDVPEYPFSHSESYWHETRLSRDWRFRKAVPRSILGVPVTDWNPLEPRWRKILRVSEAPRLEDHVVANDILFPATGSIGMALEAVRQMAQATDTILSFRIKEASFMKPIVVLKSRGTEVLTRLRPLQQAHEKANFRFQVSIFTVVDDHWSECAKFIIHIEYEEVPNEVDEDQGAQSIRQAITQNYAYAKERCTKQIDRSEFYKSLSSQGFDYGDAFSLVEDVNWDGLQLAVAHVRVGPPVEAYEGVVHPGVLDAALQLLYVAPTDGISTRLPTTVPYKMRDVWIFTTGWQCLHSQHIKVSTRSKLRPIGTGIECSLDILSGDGLPLCHVEKFDLRPIKSTGSSRDGNKLLHQIEWKPLLSLLNAGQLHRYCGENQFVKVKSSIQLSVELEKALRLVVQRHLSQMLGTDWSKAPPHMKNYVSLLRDHLKHIEEGSLEVTRREALDGKLADLNSRQPSWGIFIEVARNLLSIVRGEISASHLLLSTSLLQNYYENLFTSFANGRLKPYLELVVHQTPGQKILEIGGGSGAMTKIVLSILQQVEQRVGGLAFSQYVFTDQSESNCQEARRLFGEHQSRMTFKTLDIEQGIKTQDFQFGSFDMVIIGGSIHAMRSVPTRLQDIQRTLKPGGHLLLCDVTAPDNFTMNFGFGVLPDWWQKSRLTAQKWELLLKENQFSGHDLLIRDSDDDNLHQVSIMASTALGLPQKKLDSAGIVLVVEEDDEYQMAVALALVRNKFDAPEYQPLIATHTQIADAEIRPDPDDYVIVLIDMGKSTSSLVAGFSEPMFNLVKGLIQRSTNILWVSSPDISAGRGSYSSPYAGIKDGLSRTLRSEFSNKKIITVTLEYPSSDTLETASKISKVFAFAFIEKLPDVEYVEREGYISIGRLVEDAHLNFELSSSISPETKVAPWFPGPPLKLDMGMRGQLDTLYFVEDAGYYEELGPTDVEIEAKAWAVNFRDVFAALGRLDDPGFGFDCAGIVTRVGAKCKSIQPGDRVCMCVVDCMRMYPRGDELVVAKIPASLSFEEACAAIVPGMTALQSLVEIARIVQGDKILIHSASGATGQLAIQIAQRAGAEVFATVGYNDKKQLLINQYGIPADHIFYSRSNNFTFAQSLMKATNGQGVDVVLKLPCGRQLAKKLIQKTMAMMDDGSIHYPKPLHVHNVGAVEDAFRYIQSGKNTGRVVIRIDSHIEVRKHLITPRTWRFARDASYLVAGGLGGIGRSILSWMVSRGARNLIVPSRSGLTSAAAIRLISELEKKDVKISTPKCDVSSWDSLSQTLGECAKTFPQIRGCINAAMVLNDAVFDNMSFVQWDRTIRSKVATSWNLHSLLADLDFMVFLSSVSGVVGNPGQANYAAGCTFQDALARFRSQHGQKTISIDLGVMRTIGVVAESESLRQHFDSSAQGLGQIEDHEFFALLDVICDPAANSNTTPSQLVMGLETPMGLLARSLEPPETMQRSLFSYFSQAPSSSLHGKMNSNVAALFRKAGTAEERSSIVAQSLAHRLARSLAIKPEDVDIGKPLHAFGVDSLVAVELRNWISKEFAADVPVFELVGGRTVEGVGEFVEKSSNVVKMG
ncbi:hypothetical protein NUW58_g1586 [Xylaria curta]|uniref:Uncharacterized protein n=1 Tax=Xylaria curta TaxID=42375 RepID=A0ACC1PLB6_9PEZI|nr:hypothetical protein NUW58_g1586 [Xylaria curta]